jgi:hypothetical protein
VSPLFFRPVGTAFPALTKASSASDVGSAQMTITSISSEDRPSKDRNSLFIAYRDPNRYKARPMAVTNVAIEPHIPIRARL